MKAVILAAGLGKRLRPITENIPKAFLEINNKPLINYSLENIELAGLKDVIIVTGFMDSYFREKLGEQFNKLSIKYVKNSEYKNTGSMFSLSKIKHIINDDIILLESDLLYEKKALSLLLNSEFKDVILISKKSGSGDEVFICVDKNYRITDLGKNISKEKKKNSIGELVGISKLSMNFQKVLYREANQDYKNNIKKLHYEECIFETSKQGYPIYGLFDEELIWIEIDKYDDLKKAKDYIYPKIELYK